MKLRPVRWTKLAIIINNMSDSPGFPPDNTGLSSGSTPYSWRKQKNKLVSKTRILEKKYKTCKRNMPRNLEGND
jgi:hypothetical protein